MIARFLQVPGADDALRARIAVAVSATSPLAGASVRPVSRAVTRAISRAASAAASGAPGGTSSPFTVDTSAQLALLRAHPLFASADAAALESIASSCERAEWVAGDVIVRAGDGFCVLLDRGVAGVFVSHDSTELPTVTLGAGDDCGVASILYDDVGGEARALVGGATGWVIPEDAVLSVMLKAVEEKRSQYGQFLRGLPPLALLEDSEVLRLADFTHMTSFNCGERVAVSALAQSRFYIIAEGKIALVADEAGVELCAGDHFAGDDEAIVLSPTARLLWTDRATGKRVLGPIEDMLRRPEE